jgi:hypothetical protein
VNSDRDNTFGRRRGVKKVCAMSAAELVTVHQISEDFALVFLNVADLSDEQIARACIAFKVANLDGGDPDGLGGVIMCDLVKSWVADRLSDVLHHVADPGHAPLVLSPHGA